MKSTFQHSHVLIIVDDRWSFAVLLFKPGFVVTKRIICLAPCILWICVQSVIKINLFFKCVLVRTSHTQTVLILFIWSHCFRNTEQPKRVQITFVHNLTSHFTSHIWRCRSVWLFPKVIHFESLFFIRIHVWFDFSLMSSLTIIPPVNASPMCPLIIERHSGDTPKKKTLPPSSSSSLMSGCVFSPHLCVHPAGSFHPSLQLVVLKQASTMQDIHKYLSKSVLLRLWLSCRLSLVS